MAPERRVAVTQRVIEFPSYGEVRDSLDQEWAVFLSSCGYVPIPVPNRLDDVAAFLRELEVVGVVLTGGDNFTLDVYEEDLRMSDAYGLRDRTELAVIGHCVAEGLPAIGYCRGMQLLHVHSGGRLERVESSDHVATTHRVTLLSEAWRDLAGGSRLEVNSFHDFGFRVETVSPDWTVLAVADDGLVEGMVHGRHRLLGVGWHPERRNTAAASFDRRLLQTWLSQGDVVTEVAT